MDIRTLLRESIAATTQCRELTVGWPDYISYTNASRYGFSGIIIGEGSAFLPIVVQYKWPPDIQHSLVTKDNPTGMITDSDLKMAGLTLLYLVMESVLPDLKETNITLFSDNSPTVSWVDWLASRHSVVAGQLVLAIALRLKINCCCPLTLLYMPGTQNIMTDIPSCSFGSSPQWHCTTNTTFCTFFNKKSHFHTRIRGPFTAHPP